MLLSFLYGLIGIVLLVAFCLIGAFLVPQNAYWFMTPKAKELLEKSRMFGESNPSGTAKRYISL